MKKSFLLATVLASNIVFAQVIPTQTILTQATKLQNNSLSSMAITQLQNRGLDTDVATSKVNKSLSQDALVIDLMTQNLVSVVDEVSLEDVVSYISEAALFDRSIDLSTYSSLVSITQKKMGASLSDETLSVLAKVSFQNLKISKLI